MGECKICSTKFEPERESVFCDCCKSLIDKFDFEELNNERKWLEELFVGRFNNFLLVFSLIVTAGFANTLADLRSFIFYFGTILLLIYWQTGIVRSYHKYDTALKILLSKEKFNGAPNPVYYLEQLHKKRRDYNAGLRKGAVSKWLAIYVPVICIVFLLIVGILINLGYF